MSCTYACRIVPPRTIPDSARPYASQGRTHRLDSSGPRVANEQSPNASALPTVSRTPEPSEPPTCLKADPDSHGESVNLPPHGSESRTEADLDRSDARIVEVGVEAASSNWNGAADAAAAYREVISTIALPTDASSKGSAMQRLDKQLGHLEQLRTSSRGPETAELDGAITALCRVLGIPVPTPTPIPAPVTSPGPGASNHDGSRETAQPSATARHASEPGHSPGPSTSPNHGGSGNSDGDHQGPSSKPSDKDAKTPKPSDPPGESH